MLRITVHDSPRALKFQLDQCSGFQTGTTVWKNSLIPPPATASIT